MAGLVRESDVSVARDIHVKILHHRGHLVNQEIASTLRLHVVERRGRPASPETRDR